MKECATKTDIKYVKMLGFVGGNCCKRIVWCYKKLQRWVLYEKILPG